MRETEREQTKNLNESGHTLVIEGRNAVIEAFRSGRTIDKVFVLDGCQDGPVRTIGAGSQKARCGPELCGKGAPEPAERRPDAIRA